MGEWSRPTPGSSTGGGGTVTAATITTAPTATAGDILAGSTTALVTVVTPDGGTMMYEVTATNTKPTSTDGFSATVPTATTLAAGTYYVWYYAKGDATHSDSEISATPIEVTVSPGLSTPLTLEVTSVDDGTTITITNPSSMTYSKNGVDQGAVPASIDVAMGDKLEFYGTVTCYNCIVFGGSVTDADVKVYGNIMSLVDANFATTTAVTSVNAKTFKELFEGNTHLKDASGLLLPATTLAPNCYYGMFWGCSNLITAPKKLPAMDLSGADQCYYAMFVSCSNLTTAPELPAETLADGCYEHMFSGCSNLTTAPELPAPTLKSYCYASMFNSCTKLSSVTCLATDITASNCTYSWLTSAGTDDSASRELHIKTGQSISNPNWNVGNNSGVDGKRWTAVADK